MNTASSDLLIVAAAALFLALVGVAVLVCL